VAKTGVKGGLSVKQCAVATCSDMDTRRQAAVKPTVITCHGARERPGMTNSVFIIADETHATDSWTSREMTNEAVE